MEQETKSIIDRIWTNFWEGGVTNPLTVIEQITYLLFIKGLDDIDAGRVYTLDEVFDKLDTI